MRDSRWAMPAKVFPLVRVNKIIVHCSATPDDASWTVERIRDVHVNEKHWADIGYHWVVDREGVVWEGRPETMIGAHCKGYNHESIGVCWMGGLRGADITPAQVKAMTELLTWLHRRFPDALLYGHRDLAKTECPMLEVREMWGCVLKTV